MKTMRFAIRAHRLGGQVYVRKADLLKWLDDEARALSEEGFEDAALQTTSIADSLRKVRAV